MGEPSTEVSPTTEDSPGRQPLPPGAGRPDGLPRPARLLLRLGLVVVLVAFPLATTVLAVRYAPPAQVEIAGQEVSVRPVIGQNTSQLQNGAVIRPEHARVPVLGKDVGVDLDANWNQIIPSNKQTRRYLISLWDDPDPQVDRIASAARAHLLHWGLLGLGAGTATVVVTWLALRRRRTKLAGYPEADADLIRGHNRRLRVTAAAVGIASMIGAEALAVHVYRHEDHHVVRSSPLFVGTTLQGTEVNGLLGDILPFLSILRPRTTFYDTVANHLARAIAAEPGLRKGDNDTMFVLAEDFEDVDGMARQVGLTAHLVGADFIALSGDLTFAGKPVESYIIDTVDYYSGHTPVYFAPGPHDTDAIVGAARARGWHVADGSTHDVAGLSLLAAADPRISTVGDFGTGDVLRDPAVDVDQFVSDTVAASCDTQPDFILLHDQELGQRVAAAGCQRRAVLDGRSYQFVGPRLVPTESGRPATEFTSGSGGGHVTTEPDPGVISHPARYTVLKVNRATGETRYFVFTVSPDASVTVTPGISLEVPWDVYTATGRTTPRGGTTSTP